MARYNTVTSTSSTTGGTTFSTPAQGLLTTFSGTAPYTVNLASPGLYTGLAQSFYNNTTGTITIATPSGNIIGPGFTSSTSQTIPQYATYTLTSDGTNYVITNNEGGPQLGSTGNFTDTLTAGKATGTGLSVTANSTFGGTATFNGSAVTASSAFTPSNTYDLMTKTFTELKYGKPWTTISSGTTAAAGDRIFANTSGGGFTITLPGSPTTGDVIHIIDLAGTFSSQNLTIGNNGNRIMRQLDTMTVSTNGAAFALVWSGNASYGWLIAHGI
jgi:hypothetical protein